MTFIRWIFDTKGRSFSHFTNSVVALKCTTEYLPLEELGKRTLQVNIKCVIELIITDKLS